MPGYKLSECHPLARGKVRFVGEAIAMCVAPTRAQAEDLGEQIEVELDELPVVVDALAARIEPAIRVHDEWSDNAFLTLDYESGFPAIRVYHLETPSPYTEFGIKGMEKAARSLRRR